MEVSKVGPDSLDVLYPLWKRTNGKYADKKDEEEFLLRYFENPSVTSRCNLLQEKGDNLGAVLLESYDWGIYLYDWIKRRKEQVFEGFIDQFDALSEESKTMILAPLFGRRGDAEDWKDIGFEMSESAPYNLLMKKELLDTYESEDIQLKTERLKDPEQKQKIEALAELFTDISGRWDDPTEMEKNLHWELMGNMSYLLAEKEGDVIGYCGWEERDLFSGETMYWIKEVGVHTKEREKGIATAMIRYTLNQIREKGGDKTFIDTHSKNPAKNLYEKLGFQTIEKVPNLRYEV